MARATAARLTTTEGEELPPASAEEEEELEDIEGVITQVSDGAATVQIKRWNPAPEDPGKPWDYITTVAAKEFSLEAVKRQYGGGKYKAVTLDHNRRYVKGGSHTFTIDRMFKPAPEPVHAPEAPGPARPAPLAPEVVALVAKVDQLAALIQARDNAKDTLDTALKIAAVFRGGGGGGITPDTVFNIFEKGLDFSRRLNPAEGEGGGGEGDGGDADEFGGALREMARSVGRILESEVERRARARPAGPVPQRPALPPAEAAHMAQAPEWLRRTQPWIPQLVGLAREDADPELYADVIYDLMRRKLPEAQLVAVEEAASHEDFVTATVAVLPPSCAPYKPWFEKLLTALRAVFTESQTEEPAS